MKRQYDYAGAVSRLKQDDLMYQKISGTIVYDNGDISKGRMIYDSRCDAIFLYAKGHSRYGTIIYATDGRKSVVSLTLNEPIRQAEMDWFQNFETKVLKVCKYIKNNTHPNLWQNLKTDALKVEKNLPKLKEWFYAVSDRQVMEAGRGFYTNESQKEISSILDIDDSFFLYPHKVKTLSVRSCGFAEHVISELKAAIENKKEYHAEHRGNYDYSIRVKPHSDELVEAFLSAEFKNCLNGHYYLLLNENNSIHYEDD